MFPSLSSLRISTLLLPLLLLCGCLPEATNPISEEAKATPDARLEGAWVADDPNEKSPAYVHFLQINEHLMDVVWIEHHKPKQDGPTLWQMFPSKVGELQIMNLRPAKGSPANDIHPGHYLFARYEFADENTLKIWLPDNDAAISAISHHELTGVLTSSSVGSDVVITAKPDKLRTYFSKPESIGLFGKEPTTFKRILH